ncbi:hypothetical protein GCM10027277_57730 [Pseudoduganella ginsengisoli]
MNGQRIVQQEIDSNWANTKVDKAGDLRPGIYSLHTAKPADKTKETIGAILHVDKDYVYQEEGRSIVTHDVKAFDTVNRPLPGTMKAIKYDQGKAVAQPASHQQGRGLKR